MTHVLDQLLPALAAAIAAMPDPVKNAENPHFRNRYADLSEVLSCIEKPLRDHGLILLQRVQTDPAGHVLHSTIFHIESGQQITSTYPLIPERPGPQALGSALTYARRYSAKTMLSMVDVDDDGNAASHDPLHGERAQVRRPASQSESRRRPQEESLLEHALARAAKANTIEELKQLAKDFAHLAGLDRDTLQNALKLAREAIETVPF